MNLSYEQEATQKFQELANLVRATGIRFGSQPTSRPPIIPQSPISSEQDDIKPVPTKTGMTAELQAVGPDHILRVILEIERGDTAYAALQLVRNAPPMNDPVGEKQYWCCVSWSRIRGQEGLWDVELFSEDDGFDYGSDPRFAEQWNTKTMEWDEERLEEAVPENIALEFIQDMLTWFKDRQVIGVLQ